MTNEIKLGVAGRYKLRVLRADGSVRIDGHWFDNLVLDIGLNRLGNGGGIGSWAQVGSGSAVPANTDTALQAFVAGTSQGNIVAVGALSVTPYYGWIRRTFRFPDGMAAGNLSEVGIGWTEAGALFSRALIRDSEGNPTTITVLSDETLDVTYELRVYPPLADVTGNITIAGVVYAYVMRAAGTGDESWRPDFLLDYPTFSSPNYFNGMVYAGPIGAITGIPSGFAAAIDWKEADSYVDGSNERSFNFGADLNVANVAGGIRSIAFTPVYRTLGYYQCQFTPAIPKDATKKLTLKFKFVWGRHA